MRDDGDLGTGRFKDMGKFAADGSAADDDQALIGFIREFGAKECFRRNITAFFKAGECGNVRPSASPDKNLPAFQFF